MDTEREPSFPRRQSHRRRKPRQPLAKLEGTYLTEAEHAEGLRVQPHGDSYFLSGKVAGRAVTFLLDTGCIMNFLSRRLVDSLPCKDKAGIEPHKGERGTLADTSCIPFYGIIELTGRVLDQAIRETFIISQLKEDAILRIPFLKQHRCHIDCSKSPMVMAGQELACVDKFGRPLVGGVQVVRNCTIPGRSWATIHCKVNNKQISGLGLVEGAHDRIQLASSLNWLTARGEILVQCVNPFTESVKLPEESRQRPRSGRRTVPPHVQELYETACHATPSCCASTVKCSAARIMT